MPATEATLADPTPRAAHGLAAEDEARAWAYSVLGALLARPPDADLLAHVAALDLAPGDDGALARAWRDLRQAAASAEPGALAAEFHDLFIGLGRGELLPYGSYYLTGFLMEKPLATLRDDLARLGFARQDDVSEPEDHVAALSEVMSVLVAGDEPADLDTQRAFFEAHMAPWLARFYDDLEHAKAANFYGVVGAFGARFTAVECAAFAMAV